MGRKYVRIFVLGHCLLLVVHCFRRATLSENCSLLGTDNVRGQISVIFSPQMATTVYIFPNYENCARCEKDLKDDKDNSLHLGRKYARIFVLGHYLFPIAHSFPRATLSENCSLPGTDNVRGTNIRAYFRDYCLFSIYYTSE